MPVEQNLVLFQSINTFFQFLLFGVMVYNMVFFVWILSSWLPVNRSIAILKFVDNLINPVYQMLLKYLPPLRFGVIDFSPFYMFIFLMVIENAIEISHRLVLTLALQFLG